MTAFDVDPEVVDRVVRTALEEDLCLGADVTSTATVSPRLAGRGLVAARERGCLAGLPVALVVLREVDPRLSATLLARDGDRIAGGEPVLQVSGPLQSMLTAERTLLNLLTHLSGIASLTRRWVDAVEGTGVVVRDTRKTLPGLRALEKYAVRCGGGQNHRMALGDAALIKDNHVAAAGGVRQAVDAVRQAAPDVPLEVECDTVDQVREALDAGVTLVLLDNMSLADLRACVDLARAVGGVQLEASGGLTLDRARAVADTGVDFLAVGALTHSAPALDLGFDLEPTGTGVPHAF
jgi:nicotinate-nucleotide pyrophosphorylase (carboxylating)